MVLVKRGGAGKEKGRVVMSYHKYYCTVVDPRI